MTVKEEMGLRRILSKTYPVIGNSDGHPLNEGYKILDVPINKYPACLQKSQLKMRHAPSVGLH